MTKHVSIRVRRLTRLSDMHNEVNTGPTEAQKQSTRSFKVADAAKSRSQNRGLTVKKLPRA